MNCFCWHFICFILFWCAFVYIYIILTAVKNSNTVCAVITFEHCLRSFHHHGGSHAEIQMTERGVCFVVQKNETNKNTGNKNKQIKTTKKYRNFLIIIMQRCLVHCRGTLQGTLLDFQQPVGPPACIHHPSCELIYWYTDNNTNNSNNDDNTIT